MGSLADITLGDIGRALARYRPVAVTVAIILVVIAVLPGPRRAALNSLPTGSAPSGVVDKAPAEVATTDETVPVPAEVEPSTTFESGSSSSFSSAPSSSSTGSSSFERDEPSSSSSFSSDFSSSPSSSNFGADDSSTTTTERRRPLTVTAGGWASTAGGTPIGSTDVPPGKLPVSKRINQVEKYSFLRLDGDEKVLTLRVSTDGARTTTGVVGVSVCQITDAGWAPAENVPSDRAPKYDLGTCVPGEAAADGKSWSFNVVTFASPTDARGLALVPTGASIDYQVVFERS